MYGNGLKAFCETGPIKNQKMAFHYSGENFDEKSRPEAQCATGFEINRKSTIIERISNIDALIPSRRTYIYIYLTHVSCNPLQVIRAIWLCKFGICGEVITPPMFCQSKFLRAGVLVNVPLYIMTNKVDDSYTVLKHFSTDKRICNSECNLEPTF